MSDSDDSTKTLMLYDSSSSSVDYVWQRECRNNRRRARSKKRKTKKRKTKKIKINRNSKQNKKRDLIKRK